MNDAKRFSVISITLSFGLGIFFFLYFNYLEYQARQTLPPEMRTPEAIQNVYDGTVCLSCDIAGTGLMFLFSAIGIFIAVLWGTYTVVSKKQSTLK
jgi:hypothetical protein